MRMTVTSRSSWWWWLHVFLLVVLQHTWVSSEVSTPTNETYRGNVTTGPHQVYTNEETWGTPNTTLEKSLGNVTTRPDLTYISEDLSGTPNSTLETSAGNATTGTDLSNSNDETSGTPNTTIELYSSNITSGSHLNFVIEDTTRTPNSTVKTYSSNVTTGPDLTYISEETSRTLTNSTETYPRNATTDPDLAYTSEETTGTHYSAPEMTTTSYTGAAYCLQDADCPTLAKCIELGRRHVCQCHLGLYLHHDFGCVTARTFPAQIPVSLVFGDEISVDTSGPGYSEDEIRQEEAALYIPGALSVALLFQSVLGHIPGYLSTSIISIQLNLGLVTILHLFSTRYPVTEADLMGALFCTEPRSDCVSPLTRDNYQALSLCDFDVCDSSSSDCRSRGGLVTCECHGGYYKFSPTDRSCRACESGFQRTEHGCERCPIGFGGFNCEESYLLAVIVESCVGCVLLVSLITLLVFYFRSREPQKSTYIDSIVLGFPTDQPSIRLPRAQFSWRREWEWNQPPEKVQTDIQQEAASPDGPAIHMKTFGDPARFSTPSTYHGRQNLSFISD